jgi:nicotinamidase-related amidase
MAYDIDPRTTALLLIDPQLEYFDTAGALYTPNAEGIRDNLVSLRQAADRSGAQVVLVQHVFRQDGSDVGRMGDFNPVPAFIEGTRGVRPIEEMRPRPSDVVVSKNRYSAFVNTRLHLELESRGIDTVLVTGLMTNYCSEATARHAHDLDYRVIFVRDANAGPDMPDLGFGAMAHREVLRTVCTSLAGGVADVATTADVVARLGRGRRGLVPRVAARS